MIAELMQQWAFALRVCAPLVRASEAVDDAAHDAAEWFELAAGGRLVFLAMELVDAFFDAADWLLAAIAHVWRTCVDLWEAD